MKLLTRLLIIFISTFASSCKMEFDGVDNTVGQSVENTNYEVNKKSNEYMERYYLYNEEYRNTKRDMTLAYDKMLYTTLLSMKGNVLDNKPNPYDPTTNMLFTNITRSAKGYKSRMGESRLSTTFGFVSINYVTIDDEGNLGLCINAVYNDSPASNAGITRGYVITHINDFRLDILHSTGSTIPLSLITPSANQQVRLRCLGIEREIRLTAKEIEANPVLTSKLIAPGVGYLNLTRFDNLFDAEVMDGLASLKGCKELIVDLRLNPGGHVVEANRIATSILAPTTNRRFCQYRFNAELHANHAQTATTFGVQYDAASDRFFSNYQSLVEERSRLRLNHIYCLVSDHTASASELFINSLRGDSVEVVLIGSRTIGKNVGSYSFQYSDERYDYTLMPIMFEIFNSRNEGDYAAGLEVDHEVNDYSNFCDFNTADPMINKALEMMGLETRSDINTPSLTLPIVGKELHDTRAVAGAII